MQVWRALGAALGARRLGPGRVRRARGPPRLQAAKTPFDLMGTGTGTHPTRAVAAGTNSTSVTGRLTAACAGGDPSVSPPNLSPDASTFSVASSAQAVREHLQAHATDLAARGAPRSSALMTQVDRDASRDGAGRDANVGGRFKLSLSSILAFATVGSCRRLPLCERSVGLRDPTRDGRI